MPITLRSGRRLPEEQIEMEGEVHNSDEELVFEVPEARQRYERLQQQQRRPRTGPQARCKCCTWKKAIILLLSIILSLIGEY